jgi:hypothetical protein
MSCKIDFDRYLDYVFLWVRGALMMSEARGGVEMMTKDQKSWRIPSDVRRVSMGRYLRIQGSTVNQIEKKIIQMVRELSRTYEEPLRQKACTS